MTRVEFLTELDHRLASLSKEQADEYLAYYAEMLADRMEDGMSEEEAVASLESAEAIAARILGAAYTTPKPRPAVRINSNTVAIFAVVLVAVCGIAALYFPLHSLMTSENVEYITEEMETIPEVDEGFFYDDTEEHFSCSAADIRTLDITWVSGEISFEFWDSEEISVYEYGGTGMDCSANAGTLYIKSDSTNLNGGSGDLVIHLPYDFMEGPLDALRISVTSADVFLYELAAHELTLSTISGMADLYGRFDTVSITTTSGDIMLDTSASDVTIETVSGYVFLKCDDSLRTLKADSVSADITVILPEYLGFDLEFSAVSGTLTASKLNLYDVKDVNCSFGDSVATLFFDTISGCVYLEEG